MDNKKLHIGQRLLENLNESEARFIKEFSEGVPLSDVIGKIVEHNRDRTAQIAIAVGQLEAHIVRLADASGTVLEQEPEVALMPLEDQ